VLDQLLGEPKRFHPLVGFGRCANYLESRLNSKPESPTAILIGLLCFAVLVLPLTIAAHLVDAWLRSLNWAYLNWIFAALVVYWAVGFRSLMQHSSQVADALEHNKLGQAQYSASLMVSRDTTTMDEAQISRAVVESTLENGCDSTFGVLFWFLIGGAPMVIFYRLSNTLDAMWGYRNHQFELFGKSAAKIDDFLNFIPAQLTAFSYAICGNTRKAFSSWKAHAKLLSSPNGGPVMTSGAGSLDITLGGPAIYHASLVEKPFFGGTKQAQGSDIKRSEKLVTRALWLWLFIIATLSLTSLVWGVAS